MLKEIHEQPKAIRETLRGRMGDDGEIQLSELEMTPAAGRLRSIASSSSRAARQLPRRASWPRRSSRQWARIPVEVEVSSEFRYGDPIVDDETLVVAITQSGETADTLAGVREARERGAQGHRDHQRRRLARDPRVRRRHLHARRSRDRRSGDQDVHGADRGAQRARAQARAGERHALRRSEIEAMWEELDADSRCRRGDPCRPRGHRRVRRGVQGCRTRSLFLGRGIGVPVAMEGALKLKEISYIHAEAYAAGEMKHGPIALITEDVPVVVVATQGHTYEKVVSNIQEVRARGAEVIAVATHGDDDIARHAEHVLYVPATSELLSAIPATIPLQVLVVPHREAARLQRRPAAQPRQVSDGGVAHGNPRSRRRHRRDRPDEARARAPTRRCGSGSSRETSGRTATHATSPRSTTRCGSRPRRPCSRRSGTGFRGMRFRDVEVMRDERGRPCPTLTGAPPRWPRSVA